jgi:hypothetical protein
MSEYPTRKEIEEKFEGLQSSKGYRGKVKAVVALTPKPNGMSEIGLINLDKRIEFDHSRVEEMAEQIRKFEIKMVSFQIDIKTVEKCMRDDIIGIEKYKFDKVKYILTKFQFSTSTYP